MRSPPTSTAPAVGVSRPPIRLSSVVLPEPEGPINARKSPDGMSRFTFRNTSMRSEPRVKYFCTPDTRTSTSLITELRSGLGTWDSGLRTHLPTVEPRAASPDDMQETSLLHGD